MIGHPHFETSRDDRIAAIGDWAPARDWLRPCSKRGTLLLNCGVCEKCLPTRVAIIAGGNNLCDFAAFGGMDLEPGEIDAFRVFDPEIVATMADDHAPRREALGRQDLADAILRMHRRFMTWDEWRERAIADVANAVPDAVGVQVVDLGQLDLPDRIETRPICHHWTASWSDADGDDELRLAVERERDAGFRYVAVFSSAFWWFECYPWFEPLLEELGDLIVETERVRIVALR
jgi:hypothetical protein